MIYFCITGLNWWKRQGNLNGQIARRYEYKEASKFQNHCLSWEHVPQLVVHSCMGYIETKPGVYASENTRTTATTTKKSNTKASKWWHLGEWTEKEHSKKEIEANQATSSGHHQNNRTQNIVGFEKVHTDPEVNISHMFWEARYQDYQGDKKLFKNHQIPVKKRTK